MTPFEFLTVALSFVLGLAVTVLLTSLVTAFRHRRTTRMTWVPFAWAAITLVVQFEVWWELYGLVGIEHWSVGAFALLLLIALFLFAAGALVLPTAASDYPEDLERYFNEDGRWGMALMGAFCVTAIVVNSALFDVPLLGSMNLWNMVAVLLIITLLFSRRSAIQRVITVVYAFWLGLYLWIFVPVTH